jgi:hypothetical protein
VESARVCNISPENTAADLGTSLPFNQAAPFVYNMAVAVSPASIACTGNRIDNKQHTTDRNLISDIGPDHSHCSELFVIVSPQRVAGQCGCSLSCTLELRGAIRLTSLLGSAGILPAVPRSSRSRRGGWERPPDSCRNGNATVPLPQPAFRHRPL